MHAGRLRGEGRLTRRERTLGVLVAILLGVPALVAVATIIGVLTARSVEDMPRRVDAILAAHQEARVPLNQIPDQLSEALIAIEDERFYQHAGIDTQGLARAVLADIYHHHPVQGASTLSQQLIKVLYLDGDDDGMRKLEDLRLTLKLEARFSKHTILESYFNAVYFGHGAYGIGAAARIYFHQSPADLDLARASLLAGMPQSPSFYDPYHNPCSTRARQFNVLAQMVHDGYISQDQAARAYNEPIGFPCR